MKCCCEKLSIRENSEKNKSHDLFLKMKGTGRNNIKLIIQNSLVLLYVSIVS